MATGTMRRADSDPDYVRFGVDRNRIQLWEDGRREHSAPGEFEWWYFEFRLRLGALVVAFMDKMLTDATGPLLPVVSIRAQLLLIPFGEEGKFQPQDFQADASMCDVTIGTNTCQDTGAGVYRLEFQGRDVAGTIELRADVPPARIGTGHLLFENGADQQYLGWIVAVPCGAAAVDCKIGGHHIQETARGYHDHNWGDRPMSSAIHHWYWGRAEVGGFTVIFANVKAQPDYGSGEMAEVILIEGQTTIVSGSQGVTFTPSTPVPDSTTHKPFSGALTFTLDTADARFVVSLLSVWALPRTQQGDAAYHRDVAVCTLTVQRPGSVVLHGPVRTSYEMMWFGTAGAADAGSVFDRGFTDPAFVPPGLGLTVVPP